MRAKEFNITQQSVACLLGAGPPAGSYSSRKNKLAGENPASNQNELFPATSSSSRIIEPCHYY